MATDFGNLGTYIEPTDDQWDKWARTVNELAPDLADMLLGDRAVK